MSIVAGLRVRPFGGLVEGLTSFFNFGAPQFILLSVIKLHIFRLRATASNCMQNRRLRNRNIPETDKTPFYKHSQHAPAITSRDLPCKMTIAQRQFL
jgi:hypothetical protein